MFQDDNVILDFVGLLFIISVLMWIGVLVFVK